MGWKTSVSELGGALGQRTQYLSFDPFGRPTQVRPPDGSAHDVFLSYNGVRVVNHTARVATAVGTETQWTTTQFTDRQGRLFQVLENSGESNAAAVTTYRYDVGNHLVRVFTAPLVNGVSVGQMRHFAYDSLGFLRSETQPEKGASGNGTVTYSNYTASGQVGRKIDGANDLTFGYDRAERLVQVQETGGRLLKTFSYAGSNGTNDYRLGKLQSSTRYNYPVLGGTAYGAFVNQSYAYGGRDGRISQRTTSLTFNSTTNETFTTGFTYTPLGDVDSISYPQCTFAACTGAGATVPRTVQSTYTNGFLTAVQGYAPTISYSSNGMVFQVTHQNNVVDTEQRDPVAIHRPLSISSAGPSTNWSSGTYAYDGAGNIKAIGAATFTYDPVSRLLASTQYDQPNGSGTAKVQNYTFDPFGNLTVISGTSGRNVPTDPSTNRLTGAGVAYDAMGELTTWNGATYEYDAFGQMKHMVNGSQEWLYMYDADDERFWSFQVGGPARFDRFTLRDLRGKVLRTYELSAYNWTGSVAEDYIYRNGLLLAAEVPGNTHHFHLDHLGTPRLITDANGLKFAYHVYYPFGEEATTFSQNAERMKFTGHERDLASVAGAGDDLDYMHARHSSPVTGRFLTPDQVGGAPANPQTWNRYSYVKGNPLRLYDPTGKYFVMAPGLSKSDQAFLVGALVGVVRRPDGRAIFQRLAADTRPISLTVRSLNVNRDILKLRTQQDASMTFGKNDYFNKEGITTIALDRSIIQQFAYKSLREADSQGITTMAHELYHGDKLLNTTYAEWMQGDKPSNSQGPAQKFGLQVFAEAPDISEENARSIVDSGFSPPIMATSPFENSSSILEGREVNLEGISFNLQRP